jgi:hypothetical protein
MDQLVTLSIDDSGLRNQLRELKELLFGFLEDIPAYLEHDIERLFFDIVPGDFTATSGTGKVVRELVLRPRFGPFFEGFLATIRANKRDISHTPSWRLDLLNAYLNSFISVDQRQQK